MCCLLLVCAVLWSLHCVKHIINEEECRSVGKDGVWWDELAIIITVKSSGAVQETLGVFEECKRHWWYDRAAEGIKSKLCLGISLCGHTSPHF